MAATFAPRTKLDEPVVTEATEGVVDRGPADAEPLGHARAL